MIIIFGLNGCIIWHLFLGWRVFFYLPRLFVYHAEHKDNKGFVEVVKIQERKLYYYIQTPAMIVTLITGSLMLHAHKEVLMVGAGFMHVKLTCVTLLIIFHIHNYYCLKALAMILLLKVENILEFIMNFQL